MKNNHLITCFICILFVQDIFAHETLDTTKPFDLEYKVSLNGIPVGLKAEIKLRKLENQYLFELHSENWVINYHEKSAFVWNPLEPCLLQTESYQFTFEGFGHTEAFDIHIDRESQTAFSNTRKGKFNYPVKPNVSDALAYLFKLQCDLKQGNLNPQYEIAYATGIEHYVFRFSHKETLRTPLGKVETLVLERVYESDKHETIYWIAPELNYLMVRMKHKEGKLVTANLKIKSIDFDIKEGAVPD